MKLRYQTQPLAKPGNPKCVEIWEKASAFCILNFPTLWTASEPRELPGRGWIVPLVLRYPDGFEGALGEMAFDQQSQVFTLLTDRSVLSERAHRIAAAHLEHGDHPASPEAR